MRADEAQALVSAVRQRFPAPRLPDHPGLPGYCVGGAFCLSFLPLMWGHVSQAPVCDWRFPPVVHLARRLAHCNPALTVHQAVAYAQHVEWANDRGSFARAWDLLVRALTVGAEGADDATPA